jgi:hypothetical protein
MHPGGDGRGEMGGATLRRGGEDHQIDAAAEQRLMGIAADEATRLGGVEAVAERRGANGCIQLNQAEIDAL